MKQPAPTHDIEAFIAALPEGRAQAMTARQLAARLGLGRNGDRYLRALAEQATEDGLLVCADNAGYFKPASADETSETIGRLRSQSAKMAQRARKLQAIADRIFGRQQQLL